MTAETFPSFNFGPHWVGHCCNNNNNNYRADKLPGYPVVAAAVPQLREGAGQCVAHQANDEDEE